MFCRVNRLKLKVHSLTGRITPPLMYQAFRNVKRNRGAAGIDKVSIRMFEANLQDNLDALMRELKTRDAFQPKPLRRVLIPKGKGKMRPLGIPAVRDRIAQEVLRLLLSPIFEPLFHENSFGFRPGRNCHQALERVLSLWHQGYKVVLDADIQGFFDNIPHSVIMAGLANVVADGNILGLVERFLRAGVIEDGVFKPTTVGTPQGGVISPLLANIALNSLDWLLDQQGMRFVRYADDFVVMCRNHTQAEEVLALVQSHLSDELGLKLSPEKTQFATFSEGFAYLGFDLCSRSVTMRAKSVEKFKAKIQEITKRSLNLDEQLIVRLNQVIRGTANYFATPFSHNRKLFTVVDKWIRMRLRSMKFKRKWRTDNRRVRLKHFRRMGLLSLSDFYH
uniref:Group II intron reverse transcriptase/maturase n=4 Tax=Candidatus Kentrum sp. SD TaxID=2126332 RepID=A0A450Z7U2_9GAMM|nr:MAG: group II intron reverse transcriptase/maturase [Candidatus Kentron sp. SD]